jgi:hypothetical protein
MRLVGVHGGGHGGGIGVGAGHAVVDVVDVVGAVVVVVAGPGHGAGQATRIIGQIPAVHGGGHGLQLVTGRAVLLWVRFL